MGIIVALLVFSAVVFVHELGHFITAKKSGITVNEFSIGMGPKLFSFEKNATVYSIRLLPMGGFVSMDGEDEESDNPGAFNKAPILNRMLVLSAGAIMNLILGFLVLTILVGGEEAITSKTISSFYENSATEASGLMVGDEILAINGRKCYVVSDIFYEFARSQDGKAVFTVLRDGERQDIDIQFETYTDENGMEQLVIDFTVLPIEKTVFTVAQEALNWTISIARLVFLGLIDLVTGNVEVNQMSGPVGIVSTISDAVTYGWYSVLMMLAMITINLGVFNLIPFPALDGGRLVFLFIELLRGKPVPQKYEIFVNAAGFILLMTFMLFVTFSDISRIFG